MKNFILTSVMLMINLACIAQISVKSFVQLNDADARVNHPVIDQDGAACALIKIVTTVQGFTFDAGQLEIVKVSFEHAGEVWVYVPEGTSKLKINHRDLGSLQGEGVHNDGFYYFPTNRLKRATSYRMELTHKEVIKFIEGNGGTCIVSFDVNVNDAEVWIGEKKVGIVENGQFNTTWPKNLTLEYRIHKDRYEDVSGKIKCEKDNIVEPVELIPYFGTLDILSSKNAIIYINGTRQNDYNGILHRELEPGQYKIRIEETDKETINKSITIDRNRNERINEIPKDLYGTVFFESNPTSAYVYIDGESIGATPIEKRIVAGTHLIKVDKIGYSSKSVNKHINANGRQTISFTLLKSESMFRYNKFMGYGGFAYSPIGLHPYNIVYGIYFKKNNIEWSFSFGDSREQSIETYDYSGEITYETEKESSFSIALKYGRGVAFGSRLLITPQAGLSVYFVNCNQIRSEDNPYIELGCDVGLKMQYAIIKHLALCLQPQYSYCFKTSDVNCDYKNNLTGFSLACGFNIYF